MNQLLRPPLLKYTYTEKKIHMLNKKKRIIIIKKNSTILPPKKEWSPTTPQTEVPMTTVNNE